MKNLLITLCLMAWVSLSSWAQNTNYLQFEVGYTRPIKGKEDMLKKGIAAHTQKYHSADPYKVYFWEVLTGPMSGAYFTALGPVTFTQLDKRPSSPEHNADWQTNVSPYMEEVGEASYWRLDTALNYRPDGSQNFSKSRIRYATLRPGESDRWTEQMEKVLAVCKAKKYEGAWTVYRRYGASAGPHVCTEMAFNDWAYLDNLGDFMKDFEEVHGAGSWSRFQDELAMAMDLTKTYDELISFLPELSSK